MEGCVHVDCIASQLLPGALPSPFLPIRYFLAIRSKMHDSELVTYCELVTQRAFVLVLYMSARMTFS